MRTVIQTWGSAPQPVGSQLLIDDDGNFLGSVSGGCVEAEVIAQAAEVIATGSAERRSNSASRTTPRGRSGSPAAAPFASSSSRSTRTSPDGVLHRLMQRCRSAPQGGAGHRTGHRRAEPRSFARRSGTGLGAGAGRCVSPRQEQAAGGSGRRDLHQRVQSDARLIVVGAVHVAQHLVPMARALGYEVMVVDPRSAFATEERFGDTRRLFASGPTKRCPRSALDDRTALIALTHDPKIDDPALISALASEAFYVGALGSKKTHAKRVERLLQAGVASRRHRAHSRPDRPRHRRARRCRDRALDHRRDHRRATRQGRALMGAKIAAIVLAAGRSSRMAPRNKLLETVDGQADHRARRRRGHCERRRPGHRGDGLRG